MRAGAVSHVAVCVRSLPAAERFYVSVLGLPVVRRWTRPDGSERSIWVDLGRGAFLALEALDEPTDAPVPREPRPGWHCLALSIGVLEREAWRERLAASEVPVERESDYTLYVRDPEGALVALSHYPVSASGSPQI